MGAFEIVYVSWDKDEVGFRESLASMPWTALPFAAKDKKVRLECWSLSLSGSSSAKSKAIEI